MGKQTHNIQQNHMFHNSLTVMTTTIIITDTTRVGAGC